MLVALDRDTPQTKNGLSLPLTFSTQELMMTQKPPWLWFTLPELGFPWLTDEYCRPIHPEIEEYMPELDENRGGYYQLDRGEEGNSSNRAELGAACLALEDAKKKTG